MKRVVSITVRVRYSLHTVNNVTLKNRQDIRRWCIMENYILIPPPPCKPLIWLNDMCKIQNLNLHLVLRSYTNSAYPFIPSNSRNTAILIMPLAVVIERERNNVVSPNDRVLFAQNMSGPVYAGDRVTVVLMLGIDVSPKTDHRRRIGAIVRHDGIHECTVRTWKNVRDEGRADVLELKADVVEGVVVPHSGAASCGGWEVVGRGPYDVVNYPCGVNSLDKNGGGLYDGRRGGWSPVNVGMP
jgi:hypothetical protein